MIPKEARLSPEATDLLRKLICSGNERLGINGVDEIKAHPFFKGVDWKRIRDKQAPNIPKLKHAEDTSIFDDFPEIDPWLEDEPPLGSRKDNKKHKKNRVNDVHFIGYTYKRSLENAKMQSIANLFEEIDNTRESARQRQNTAEKDYGQNNMPVQKENMKINQTDKNVITYANDLQKGSSKNQQNGNTNNRVTDDDQIAREKHENMQLQIQQQNQKLKEQMTFEEQMSKNGQTIDTDEIVNQNMVKNRDSSNNPTSQQKPQPSNINASVKQQQEKLNQDQAIKPQQQLQINEGLKLEQQQRLNQQIPQNAQQKIHQHQQQFNQSQPKNNNSEDQSDRDYKPVSPSTIINNQIQNQQQVQQNPNNQNKKTLFSSSVNKIGYNSNDNNKDRDLNSDNNTRQ